MRILRVLMILLICMLPIQRTVQAQDQLPKRGPAAERIDQYKKLRLMEALRMNEEVSIRFFARYNKQQENMRNIEKERNEFIDQLQSLNKSNENTAAIENTIKNIRLCEEKLLEERLIFIDGLRDILSLNQLSSYIIFERNFNKNLRELMKDAARDRWNR
jgi:hypothetical protein